MMKISLNILCLLMIVYVVPLYGQQHADTSGLAAEMAVMYKPYADKQYAFDIRYTFAALSKPDILLDSMAGRLEAVENNFRYQFGNTASITNGRYNIMLQSAMKRMHVAKAKTGDQPMKMIQTGFPPVTIKSWSVSQQGNERIFHADFLPGFPFITIDVKKDMVTGHLTAMRYVIPASQLKRFGSDKEDVKEDFGDYAIVCVTYLADKKYKPDMTVFDEQRYFHKTEKVMVPSPAFSDYQLFKVSPDL